MVSTHTRDQFIAAYKTAPRVVREAMASDATIQVINSIQAAYNLHVDTTGKISQELGYMLLGLVDPATFYQGLLELKIEEANATAIVKKVNEEIFQPLQKRIREGAGGSTSTEDEEPEAEYDPTFNVSPKTESVSTPLPVAPVPQVPVLQVQARAEVKATPPEIPPYNLIRLNEVLPAAVQVEYTERSIRTMRSDIEAMEHPPMKTTPARSFQTSSVPFTTPPATPLYAPDQLAGPVAVTPSRPVAEAPTAAHVPDPAYGKDPYRELPL